VNVGSLDPGKIMLRFYFFVLLLLLAYAYQTHGQQVVAYPQLASAHHAGALTAKRQTIQWVGNQ
jgi:hypothetical protein